MSEKISSKQTAYDYNSVNHVNEPVLQEYGWAKAINRMIGQRYSFLPQKYQEDQYLFRGMSSGLFKALLNDCFWHFDSSMHVAQFEQEQEILCVSQDFSDAYTVARLWDHQPEACILITRAEVFSRRLQERQAAMLAMAEPGVVFKYPFFTAPLRLNDVHQIIVCPLLWNAIETGMSIVMSGFTADEVTLLEQRLLELRKMNRLFCCADVYDRKQLEQQLIEHFAENSIVGATVVKADLVPSRQT